MKDKIDKYIKNQELDYKDIYGIKGIIFCNNIQKYSTSRPKKTCRVKFSNNIQYSRN